MMPKIGIGTFMVTFGIIKRNSMSMGFSHAKFGQAKNEKKKYYIKMFHVK